MNRYIVTILVLQSVPIGVCALMVPSTLGVSREDCLELEIPLDQVATERLDRYGLPCLDLNTALPGKNGSKDLWVSVRLWATDAEYQERLKWDRLLGLMDPTTLYIAEDTAEADERGYYIRHRGRRSVFVELVRHRGAEMLIVRVSHAQNSEEPGVGELSSCETTARTVLRRMKAKLKWPESPEAVVFGAKGSSNCAGGQVIISAHAPDLHRHTTQPVPERLVRLFRFSAATKDDHQEDKCDD